MFVQTAAFCFTTRLFLARGAADRLQSDGSHEGSLPPMFSVWCEWRNTLRWFRVAALASRYHPLVPALSSLPTHCHQFAVPRKCCCCSALLWGVATICEGVITGRGCWVGGGLLWTGGVYQVGLKGVDCVVRCWQDQVNPAISTFWPVRSH